MNGAHLHLLLNHVPILGVIFGLILLSVAMPRRNQIYARLALQVFVVIALFAIPVYISGEPAEEVIHHVQPSAGASIEPHEDAALASLAGLELLGALAAAGLWTSRRSRELGYGVLVTAWAGALLVTASIAWTAYLGGQIAHPEIRSSTEVTRAVASGR